MSVFKFQIGQRVIVPAKVAGVADVQGVVDSGSTMLGGRVIYTLQYLDESKRDSARRFEVVMCSVYQDDLIAAQPPAMVTEEEATRRCKVCFDDGHMSAMETIRREREARARKRKKPAKAKSKSKRKH